LSIETLNACGAGLALVPWVHVDLTTLYLAATLVYESCYSGSRNPSSPIASQIGSILVELKLVEIVAL
jgi:hypothetical protein